MAKRRRFTPEFKVEVVLESLLGENSQAEVVRQNDRLRVFGIFCWVNFLIFRKFYMLDFRRIGALVLDDRFDNSSSQFKSHLQRHSVVPTEYSGTSG